MFYVCRDYGQPVAHDAPALRAAAGTKWVLTRNLQVSRKKSGKRELINTLYNIVKLAESNLGSDFPVMQSLSRMPGSPSIR